jgi:diguanylate cyclase (GGDEF)-like protein
MNSDDHPSPLNTYILYIGVSIAFTNLLNLAHALLLNNDVTPLSFIMPTLAGLVFGYLITHNKILKDKMARLASTDILTGVYNRMQFDRFLNAQIDKSRRYSEPFSVIYIDIDHFKKVNDKYGHATGDEVLKTFAGILQNENRISDILARYGGEEFVIIAYNANLQNANKHAERLLQAVRNHSFNKVGNVTCSMGVAEFHRETDSASTLLKRADTALYKAKESGRNRIERA